MRWTDEGLAYEASGKHRQALLEGLGLSEESKTVNSAAVKPEEIGKEEDANMLDEAQRKQFKNLAATLNCMSLDGSDVMANPTQGSWRRLKGAEKVTWAMRAWERDERKVDVGDRP